MTDLAFPMVVEGTEGDSDECDNCSRLIHEDERHYHINLLENLFFAVCSGCRKGLNGVSQVNPEVETLPNYNIKWKGVTLPINGELFDAWNLDHLEFNYPVLTVPVRIMYVPDDEFDEMAKRELSPDKPPWWKFWKYPRWWWQSNKTRAFSYRGRIYIKRSAKNDRKLLLHELGHTFVLLDHGNLLRFGIMNPARFMWVTGGVDHSPRHIDDEPNWGEQSV